MHITHPAAYILTPSQSTCMTLKKVNLVPKSVTSPVRVIHKDVNDFGPLHLHEVIHATLLCAASSLPSNQQHRRWARSILSSRAGRWASLIWTRQVRRLFRLKHVRASRVARGRIVGVANVRITAIAS